MFYTTFFKLFNTKLWLCFIILFSSYIYIMIFRYRYVLKDYIYLYKALAFYFTLALYFRIKRAPEQLKFVFFSISASVLRIHLVEIYVISCTFCRIFLLGVCGEYAERHSRQRWFFFPAAMEIALWLVYADWVVATGTTKNCHSELGTGNRQQGSRATCGNKAKQPATCRSCKCSWWNLCASALILIFSPLTRRTTTATTTAAFDSLCVCCFCLRCLAVFGWFSAENSICYKMCAAFAYLAAKIRDLQFSFRLVSSCDGSRPGQSRPGWAFIWLRL